MTATPTPKTEWCHSRKELIDSGFVVVIPKGTPYPEDYAEKHDARFDMNSLAGRCASADGMVMIPAAAFGGDIKKADAGLVEFSNGYAWGGTHEMKLGKLPPKK